MKAMNAVVGKSNLLMNWRYWSKAAMSNISPEYVDGLEIRIAELEAEKVELKEMWADLHEQACKYLDRAEAAEAKVAELEAKRKRVAMWEARVAELEAQLFHDPQYKLAAEAEARFADDYKKRAEAAESKLADIAGLPEKWRSENPAKGWADDKSDEAYDAGCGDGARLCATELQAKLKGE